MAVAVAVAVSEGLVLLLRMILRLRRHGVCVRVCVCVAAAMGARVESRPERRVAKLCCECLSRTASEVGCRWQDLKNCPAGAARQPHPPHPTPPHPTPPTTHRAGVEFEAGSLTRPPACGVRAELKRPGLARVAAMHSAQFANKGRKAIGVPNVTLAVMRALAVPSSCVPEHAVMLSMATTHHMRLRPVQFARVAHLPCFLSRLVSVCYGFTDAYGECVVGECNQSMGLANPCLPSDYRRSQYVALNWAKWPLFIDTLRVARSALWLEADVVILRNPWELLLAEAELAATVNDAVRYQYEAPPCTIERQVVSTSVQCVKSTWPAPHPEPLNCGQLLVRARPQLESRYGRAVTREPHHHTCSRACNLLSLQAGTHPS